MKKLLDFLSGKKTYIGVIAGAVYQILILTGHADSDPAVWTAIATWTGISFRLAVSNTSNK